MMPRGPRRVGLRHCVLTGLAVIVFAGATQVGAQQPTTPPPAAVAPVVVPPATRLLSTWLQNGITLERYQEQLRSDFFNIDSDADGRITVQDVDLHVLMERIRLRVFSVSLVMRHDLDDDGFVTEDEIRRGMNYEMRAQLARAATGKPAGLADATQKEIDAQVRGIMAVDADKDGKVSTAEAANYSRAAMQRVGVPSALNQNTPSAKAQTVLTLDTSSKGAVSLAEYLDAGATLFRRVDSDGDGTVSQQELADYRRQPAAATTAPDPAAVQAAQEAKQKLLAAQQAEIARKKAEAAAAARAGCEMPPASAAAKVIVLSAYEAEAISSATIGSQDVQVRAGRVVVEPGSEPLYIVMSMFRASIWQFSGATERIERLVMSSMSSGPNESNEQRPPLVGATGIAADKIAFLSRTGCLRYFTESPSSGSFQTAAAVREATGKEVGTAAAKYAVGGFAVPSGKIEGGSPDRKLVIDESQGTLRIIGEPSGVVMYGGPSRARGEMNRFFPGGVVGIDPKTVVASRPAMAYEVLPSQAGLVQLLGSGAISENKGGEYIVRQKIRFPAELNGAHSVTFLILKGVPYPDGDSGHSCVYVEDTGEKKGGSCR